MAVSVLGLFEIRHKTRTLTAENVRLALIVGQIEAYGREQDKIIESVFAGMDSGSLEKRAMINLPGLQERFKDYQNLIIEAHKTLRESSEAELESVLDAQLRDAYDDLGRIIEINLGNYKIYGSVMETVFSEIASGDVMHARRLVEDLEATEERILRLTDELEKVRMIIFNTSKTLAPNIERFIIILGVISLAAMLVLFFSSRYLTKCIVKPLNRAVLQTEMVAQGERQTVVLFDEPEEFHKLFQSLNAMVESIKKTEELLESKALELRQSNEQLELFASAAAHDLKSPLNAIMGYTDLIAVKLETLDTLDDDDDDLIEKLRYSVNIMANVIDNLLNYSRVEGASMNLTMNRLEDVVEDVLEVLLHEIKRSDAEVTVQRLPLVRVNREAFFQVFENLIGNALKYKGHSSPKVIISSSCQGGEWIIKVADNGQGIKSEYLASVFHLFNRGDSREKPTGTGIGLATVQKIVEKHGGRIWVESEVGVGSEFMFTIPANQPK